VSRGSRRREMYLRVLRHVVLEREPNLSPLVEQIGKRQLSEGERESLRVILAAELLTSGMLDEEEPNSRGALMDEIIGWLSGQ
jgi:hypothetical protein